MTIPQPLDFLDAVTGHVDRGRSSSADRPIRLATVDPAYDPFFDYPAAIPAARVTFEGETTLSAKAYAVAGGFVPRAGQRVYLLPQGNGYLIAGSVNTQTPQGFWQDASGAESGVELGGGSYYDTTDGLYLEGDLTVTGQAIHGPRGFRVPEIQVGETLVSFAASAGFSQAVTFPTAWPVGTKVYMPAPNIASIAPVTAQYFCRAISATPTGFTLWSGASDAARVAQTWSNIVVQWVAIALPAS